MRRKGHQKDMTSFDVRCLIPSIILIITLRVKDENKERRYCVKMNFHESVLIRLGLPLFKGRSQHSWGLAVTEDGDHQSCCMPIQKGLSFVVLIDCSLWRTLKKIRC